jgi:hypothetical protein
MSLQFILLLRICEGFENNNLKPFWNYMKSKKQYKLGVALLKRSGGLTNESKEKAEILNNQFKSVFTKPSPLIFGKCSLSRAQVLQRMF